MNPIELDTQLCQQLPPWYREVLDYQQICQTETEQFDALAAEIVSVADNFFFQTMGLSGVEMWEQIFGILPNPRTEDIEFRRYRVLNRITTKPPYTLGFLYQKLDELIGPGLWKVTMDYPNYTLYIESSSQNQKYATEVAYTIGQTKPAHIAYVNTPLIQSGITLTESISTTPKIYNYKLGSWKLGVRPFITYRKSEVVKLPGISSIQESLLTGVANFVSGDVKSARINNAIIIDTLAKTVVNSTLTITYPVSATQASEITNVQLLDAEGSVLTSSQVYVPVGDSVLMKHVIPVKEGV